ncbi:MAG TPA: winged helix-turn-helix domain-containing protein [Chloroflexota bacterium]|jgi:DNA-binding transcriptional ArsR family regulator
MRVKDLSPVRTRLGITIAASPVAEMLTGLNLFLDEKFQADLEVGKEWLDGVRSSLSADFQADLRASGMELGKDTMYLLPALGESAAFSTCQQFLAHLADADPLVLRLATLGEWDRLIASPTAPDLVTRAARGDLEAVEACVALGGECVHTQEAELRARLSRDLEDGKRRLVALLTDWYEQVFKEKEAELTVILERDAAAKRRQAARLTPSRQIEVVTNGLRYTPEPGITRVLLIPSVVCRPWVLMCAHRETKIFIYAVAEESLSDDVEPSRAHVLTLAKALSDERRLQVLQLLAARGATLQELADSLGVGKSLMHHHMVTLRAAGLVRVQLGGDRHYELREEALTSLPGLLRGLLGRRDKESTTTPTS